MWCRQLGRPGGGSYSCIKNWPYRHVLNVYFRGQGGAKKEVAAAKFVDKESLRRAEVEILTLQQLAEQRAVDVCPTPGRSGN